MGLLEERRDAVLQATHPNRDRISTYGNRPDGTPKGAGYYGEIQNPYLPPGNFSGELTIGVSLGGKDMNIPALVPGLTQSEIRALLQAKNAKEIPESIVQKAVAHARQRLSQGKSPYADPGEYHPLPKD